MFCGELWPVGPLPFRSLDEKIDRSLDKTITEKSAVELSMRYALCDLSSIEHARSFDLRYDGDISPCQ